MPWIGFIFLMGHMSANQLNRQFANAPGKVDITGRPSTFSAQIASNYIPGAQMVLVMKVTLHVLILKPFAVKTKTL